MNECRHKSIKEILDEAVLQSPRRPVCSIKAEKAVIGYLLIDDSEFEEIGLLPTDFYLSAHNRIFSHIAAKKSCKSPCNLSSVIDSIDSVGQLADVGGSRYLSELADSAPEIDDFREFVVIVRDRSDLRQLVHCGEAEFGDGSGREELKV